MDRRLRVSFWLTSAEGELYRDDFFALLMYCKLQLRKLACDVSGYS